MSFKTPVFFIKCGFAAYRNTRLCLVYHISALPKYIIPTNPSVYHIGECRYIIAPRAPGEALCAAGAFIKYMRLCRIPKYKAVPCISYFGIAEIYHTDKSVGISYRRMPIYHCASRPGRSASRRTSVWIKEISYNQVCRSTGGRIRLFARRFFRGAARPDFPYRRSEARRKYGPLGSCRHPRHCFSSN